MGKRDNSDKVFETEAIGLNKDDFPLDDEGLTWLTRALADLPDRNPPADLAARILAAAPVKRPSMARLFWRWARRPQNITFTPLRAVPALAGLAAMIVLSSFLFLGGPEIRQAGTGQVGALAPVVFTLEADRAETVYVIGSFNLWNPKAHQMKRDVKTGVWQLEVTLPAGRHEYSFLIDGKVAVPDPHASFFKDDGFGSKNSVIMVENELQI